MISQSPENLQPAIKWSAISGLALATTTLVFLMMQWLIDTGLDGDVVVLEPEIEAPLQPALREPDRVESRSRPERQIPTLPPEVPMGIPILPEELVVFARSPEPAMSSMAERILYDDLDLKLAPPIQDLLPLYVVEPTYPASAVLKEIEGFVVVNFDVRENGSVMNPIVVESRPGSLFDEAALTAVSRFRFQPRMAAGDAQAVHDMKIRFVFSLKYQQRSEMVTLEAVQ